MKDYGQRKIYVLGNGFDIAAKLPTRYTDFMCLLDNWRDFYDEYSRHFLDPNTAKALHCPPDGKLMRSILMEYAKCTELFCDDHIQQLNTIIENNPWITYFKQCKYEEPGWAGFEKEIKEALRVIDKMITEGSYLGLSQMMTHENAVYLMLTRINHPECIRTEECFSVLGNGEEVASYRKEVIDTLAQKLLEFAEAFRLYLLEFVERMKLENNPGIAISETDQTYVISLNYTHNQLVKAGIKPDHIHMIHGSDQIRNNLVMGIENDEHLGNEFIRYKKYFQRIQKKTGSDYKLFFSLNAEEVGKQLPTKVVFFGHSLDPIDADFIREIFLVQKIDNITIHYCNPKDYEQKIINCVDILGADYLIDAVAKGTIVFTDEALI